MVDPAHKKSRARQYCQARLIRLAEVSEADEFPDGVEKSRRHLQRRAMAALLDFTEPGTGNAGGQLAA